MCIICSYYAVTPEWFVCSDLIKEIDMAQDIGGEVGKVSFKLDEKEIAMTCNALLLLAQSKTRAANANSNDADLNKLYNGQARMVTELLRKFGG